MSPQDLYSVAVRTIGLAMAAFSIAACLLPVIGVLSLLAIGLVLLFAGGRIAKMTFHRDGENFEPLRTSLNS
jgi:hypothetical protein